MSRCKADDKRWHNLYLCGFFITYLTIQEQICVNYFLLVIYICDENNFRRYMILACRLGMCNGEYVFITTYLGMPSTYLWQQNDAYDDLAKKAFRNLIYVWYILNLVDKCQRWKLRNIIYIKECIYSIFSTVSVIFVWIKLLAIKNICKFYH